MWHIVGMCVCVKGIKVGAEGLQMPLKKQITVIQLSNKEGSTNKKVILCYAVMAVDSNLLETA